MTNYVYDADGNRVQKGTSKLYWNNLGGTPIAESDLAGNISDEYIFLSGDRIARRDASSNIYLAA